MCTRIHTYTLIEHVPSAEPPSRGPGRVSLPPGARDEQRGRGYCSNTLPLLDCRQASDRVRGPLPNRYHGHTRTRMLWVFLYVNPPFFRPGYSTELAVLYLPFCKGGTTCDLSEDPGRYQGASCPFTYPADKIWDPIYSQVTVLWE